MKNKNPAPLSLSRRGFLRTSALSAAGGSLLLGTSLTAQASESDSSLLEISRKVVELQAKQPHLPGLLTLHHFASEAYPRDLKREDAEILNAALFLNASRLLTIAPDYVSADRIEPGLQEPLPTERLGKEFFYSTLVETKERMAADGEFAESIRRANESVRKLEIASGNPSAGEPAAFIIIIIIILIIILVCWPTKAH